MPSGFGAVSTTRAVVIVPFPMLQHHMSNSRVSASKLRYPEVVQQRGGGRCVAYGQPVNQGEGSCGEQVMTGKVFLYQGELRENRTRPCGLEVSLAPELREQDQDSPKRGPTGRLGMP